MYMSVSYEITQTLFSFLFALLYAFSMRLANRIKRNQCFFFTSFNIRTPFSITSKVLIIFTLSVFFFHSPFAALIEISVDDKCSFNKEAIFLCGSIILNINRSSEGEEKFVISNIEYAYTTTDEQTYRML